MGEGRQYGARGKWVEELVIQVVASTEISSSVQIGMDLDPQS